MPTLRAIVSVDAPSKPWSANSVSAASSRSSRRSPAVFRTVTSAFMVSKLSLTHNACQGLLDPVQVRFGEPRVERQRQRSLVRVIGPGERALVGVRREAVQRIGADLRLDVLRA